MTAYIHLNISVVSAKYMWFRPLGDVPLANYGKLVDNLLSREQASVNYDFERMPNNLWLLHIDVGLCVSSVAEIKVRTSFQTMYDGAIESILQMEVMHDIVSISIDKCLNGFNEQCEANGIAYRHQKIGLNIKSVLEHVRSNFEKERKPLEGTWHSKKLLSFTHGRKTFFLCTIPFMIMDEVFFYASDFEQRHNAAILFKHVPETLYYTVKLRCASINKNDVELSGMHSIYYLICLDCALQMLVGNHADRFEQLVASGLTSEVRKEFLTLGTEYFDMYRTKLSGKGVRFINFENRPDWNEVIR